MRIGVRASWENAVAACPAPMFVNSLKRSSSASKTGIEVDSGKMIEVQQEDGAPVV